MLVQTNNNIQGVVGANDNIAGAVVATLKAKGLKPIALSGQDATVQGVQNIISGWQTNTVYKYVPDEANAAAAAAIALYKGKKPPSNTTRPNGKRKQPTFVIPVTRSPRRTTRGSSGTSSSSGVRSAPGSGRSTASSRIAPGDGGALARLHRFSRRTPSRERHTTPRDPRPDEDVRLGAGADRRRLRGAVRRGDGTRRRQRRRQVDAHQVHRRHPRPRLRRDPLRGQARHDPRAEGRGQARDRGRVPGPRALRQPRRRPEHVPRPRDPGHPLPAQGACDGAAHRGDPQGTEGDDDPIRSVRRSRRFRGASASPSPSRGP